MDEGRKKGETLGMELIGQAEELEGLSVCAEALAAALRDGGMTAARCSGAVALLGKEIRRISAGIMRLQEEIGD